MLNLNYLRVGLAVIALQSLVCASPIVQTQTSPLSVGPIGRLGGGIGTDWNFDRHDPAMGLLTSVSIAISWDLQGRVFELNPFTDPALTFNYTPTIDFSFFPTVVFPSSPGSLLVFPPWTGQMTGPQVVMPPSAVTTFSGLLHGGTKVTFTAPADLALFTGTDAALLRLSGSVQSNTFSGGTNAGGAATMQIIYGVPEGGSTALLLGSVLVALMVFARRRGAMA